MAANVKANFYSRFLEAMFVSEIEREPVKCIFLTIADWFRLLKSCPLENLDINTTKRELLDGHLGSLSVRYRDPIHILLTEHDSSVNRLSIL
jgi:hypothetical protein